MEKKTKIAGLITVAFLITGCQDSESEGNSKSSESSENGSVEVVETDDHTEADNESGNNSDTEDGTSDGDGMDTSDEVSNDEESDTDVYGGSQKTPDYFIDTHVFNHESGLYTAYAIHRDENEEQALSPEERLETSLLNNDPSEQDILSSYAELSSEWPNLSIHFNEEGNELAATTAQSSLFFDALFGISDLYGIEEITFLNPEGEKDMTVAERTVYESITVKDERGLTRGYYTIYDEGLEETLFLPGGELEEHVVNGNDEPLSFPETIEAMSSVDRPDAFYSSAIVEGIQIVDSSITNGVATVQYTMDEEIVTDADRTVFENAIQLTALDFHAWEVEIMNDTLKESNTYPLIGQ
ncbi:hypothetical protein E2R51_08520 [Jeotgalibacillus sp. S-D1]|uniref:hypothetical protein n=1 Tax=Jeotgalibacillus sp. S-D1 TaxID=2552189 RepID=UPI00105AAABD|nr:hypothetical protein [Jeotgalibacillus sp. S-D1]TDL32711.1 hypothetical protein E2R51_08520 [Jeotgalibacillus sp. S-D1]